MKLAGETYKADGNMEVPGNLEMTKGLERRFDVDGEWMTDDNNEGKHKLGGDGNLVQLRSSGHGRCWVTKK